MNYSRKWIAKNIGFRLQDAVKGTSIMETLKLLQKSQYWDETRIKEYQLNKLRVLIDYASNHVPYYEEQFKKLKLNSKEIRKLEDIQKLPILTKQIVREENQRLVSRSYSGNVKRGKTGGTTGSPVEVRKDVHTRSFTWASYYRWYEWMGLNYYDPSATFWGVKTVLSTSLKTKIKDDFTRLIQNNIVLNSFDMNEMSAMGFYNRIMKQGPFLLKGYLSSLLDFANYVESNNLEFCKVKAISTTTETLLPHHRQYLESVFRASVFDQYGCGEINAISYECAKHNGLHINQEHVICEVLDDKDTPIMNFPGRVIATDLDNLVMPFIRYENGDLTTLTDRKCTCGVNQPLMKSIEGRSIDTITLSNGSKVHGVFFTDIFYEIGILSKQVTRFQIYQEKVGEIEIRLECKNALNQVLKRKLLNSLEKYFTKVVYLELSKIKPEPNGKFKYIVNAISQ